MSQSMISRHFTNTKRNNLGNKTWLKSNFPVFEIFVKGFFSWSIPNVPTNLKWYMSQTLMNQSIKSKHLPKNLSEGNNSPKKFNPINKKIYSMGWFEFFSFYLLYTFLASIVCSGGQVLYEAYSLSNLYLLIFRELIDTSGHIWRRIKYWTAIFNCL